MKSVASRSAMRIWNFRPRMSGCQGMDENIEGTQECSPVFSALSPPCIPPSGRSQERTQR